VLLTHCPPHGLLDKTRRGKHAGCPILLETSKEMDSLRLHVWGHIHEAFGACIEPSGKVSTNAAILHTETCVVIDLL
jgi:Icc-related predicted phosphoesterase